jgi:hypothetical protein
MASLPTARAEVVQVAVPEETATFEHVPMAVPLEVKLTVPVGGPPEAAVMVAVNVTDDPKLLAFWESDEVTAVVVVELTYWVSGDDVEVTKPPVGL